MQQFNLETFRKGEATSFGTDSQKHEHFGANHKSFLKRFSVGVDTVSLMFFCLFVFGLGSALYISLLTWMSNRRLPANRNFLGKKFRIGGERGENAKSTPQAHSVTLRCPWVDHWLILSLFLSCSTSFVIRALFRMFYPKSTFFFTQEPSNRFHISITLSRHAFKCLEDGSQILLCKTPAVGA